MSDAVPAVPAASPVVAAIAESDALTLLRRAVLVVADLAEQHKGNPEATGAAFIYLNSLLADLRSVVNDLKRWTGETIPGKRLVIPGAGVLERVAASSKAEWDHRAACSAVVQWGLNSGAICGPADVPDVLLKFAHIDYWRKTEMREAGIDLSALVETTYGDPSVKQVG